MYLVIILLISACYLIFGKVYLNCARQRSYNFEKVDVETVRYNILTDEFEFHKKVDDNKYVIMKTLKRKQFFSEYTIL